MIVPSNAILSAIFYFAFSMCSTVSLGLNTGAYDMPNRMQSGHAAPYSSLCVKQIAAPHAH